MVTPKKKHKIRDADLTRRKLLDAIGEILLEFGYTGLKVNKIARHIGKDKSTIRYHYGRLIDLERAWIKEQDYWPPFFERFQLTENPDAETMRNLFAELMQQNFAAFMENREMQKIILWQISEANPLMRSISDARETEGARLLSKTDTYFASADVSFKAVMALLLGGVYYLVLHAHSNKSTVCGIDINLEKDSALVMKTIDQIIKWAWMAVEKEPA